MESFTAWNYFRTEKKTRFLPETSRFLPAYDMGGEIKTVIVLIKTLPIRIIGPCEHICIVISIDLKRKYNDGPTIILVLVKATIEKSQEKNSIHFSC